MGLSIASTAAGRNSPHIRNSPLSPAKLVMLEQQGSLPLSVSFDIVGHQGQFTDTTVANYASRGSGVLGRYGWDRLSKASALRFFKGELTTKYDGVSPKRISFDIIYRADVDLPPDSIRKNVIILQSMCYPRLSIALNPPLCTLHILNLYSLEVYVEQVLVTWHNQWTVNQKLPLRDQGLPMGCDIAVTCLMHQYPTRDEILCGAGFDSTKFMGTGYSGTLQESATTLTHDHKCIEDLTTKNNEYNNDILAEMKLAKDAREKRKRLEDREPM